MTTPNKQKELLLILHTNFFSKNWVSSNHAEKDGWFAQKEQLKEACRNGKTPEVLPESYDPAFNTRLRPCNINDANTFIDLVFCKHTQTKEKQFSLNPYIFMQVQGLN